MKIAVITGSPHKQGATSLLADAFIQGAKAAGHEVIRFDAAFHQVNSCLGCGYCADHEGRCAYKDDMLALRPVLLKADLVCFVTPLYYYGTTAQLKRVVDRFYAFNSQLLQANKKTVLLAACADTEPGAYDALLAHYAALTGYLGWQDRGKVLAYGISSPSDLDGTGYPEEARQLGASLPAM